MKVPTKKKLPSLDEVEPPEKVKLCLKGQFEQWALDLSNYSSLHAVGWYNRVDSSASKTFILLCSIVIMMGLPVVIVYQMVMYANDIKVNTAVEWRRATSTVYPNLTVCNTRFFDTRKFPKFNMTDELANYITLALDPGLSGFYNYMASDESGMGSSFRDAMDNMAMQLDTILSQFNITLDVLFEELALECEDFIFFCEDHRRFFSSRALVPDWNGPTCCTTYFNPKPIFTTGGTCYTTNAVIVEDFPSSFNSIKIYLDTREGISPKYFMKLKGADAAERRGIVWAISHNDSPGVVLATNPRKASAKISIHIGLKFSETDRSSLDIDGQPCMNPNKTFEETFGVKSTRKNCEGLYLDKISPNCSMLWAMGFKSTKPACVPRDLLVPGAVDIHESSMTAEDLCPYDCERIDFEISESSSHMNEESLMDYLNSPEVLAFRQAGGWDGTATIENTTSLQLYFQSFDYAVHILTQETYLDFFSKVGGSVGLVIGASIFSFLEIAYFLLRLTKITVKHFVM